MGRRKHGKMKGKPRRKFYQICLIRQLNDLLFGLINDDKVFLAPRHRSFIHETLLRIKMSSAFDTAECLVQHVLSFLFRLLYDDIAGAAPFILP